MAKQIGGIVPRFGSNRINAHRPAELLKDCSWIGVPFVGSSCEVRHFAARSIVLNDLDRALVNLGLVIADTSLRNQLQAWARLAPVDIGVLAIAQARCKARQEHHAGVNLGKPDLQWACDYFAACWMARNDSAGTDKELNAGLSVRWNAGGGDSVKRVRSAAEALTDWGEVFTRCGFLCMDGIAFVDRCEDNPENGIYVDAPWPDDGDKYLHKFGSQQQRELAKALSRFKQTRVVIRYGEHPLIRELYPPTAWRWIELSSRTQANKIKAEALICNAAVAAVE